MIMSPRCNINIYKSEPLRWHHFSSANLYLIDRFFIHNESNRPNFNRRMFDEDFSRLFNYVSKRNRELFEITSSDDRLLEELLSSACSRRYHRNISEKIVGLVEDIAQPLIEKGKTYYYVGQGNQHERINIFSLNSNGVFHLFNYIFQWIPERIEKQWNQPNKLVTREVRILDNRRVMQFKLPFVIKRIVSAQNKTLGLLDKNQFSRTDFFDKATYEAPNPPSNFNFQLWTTIQDKALYKATRKTEWGGRKYDSAKKSDFFDCHRLLRFRRNQLIVRDDILKQLSRQLSKVGRLYNKEFTVDIKSSAVLPSISELNELEKELEQERISFNEITDYCFKK